MSYSIDVNILLYASDKGSPYHAKAAAFLKSCANRGEPLCLAWPTVMGYLRISTHSSIFGAPLSPDEALQNVDHLLAMPQVRLISEEEGFWSLYREITRGIAVRGNLVPDCHLAGILKQHEVRTLYTNDLDFRRFDFLKVLNPLAGAGEED